MIEPTATSRDYALGDSPDELERLHEQAVRLRTLTERFLLDAGIAPGMRVLELGAGLGDVTMLIAQRVGRSGQVVSLEKSPAMLARAIEQRAISAVRFIQCDINRLDFRVDGPFDAVVGRLILTHLDDPAATLRRAAQLLRPGGIVAFQEADFTLSNYLLALHRERLPLTYQVCQWIALARGGSSMQPQLGLDLYHLFQRAGLPAPAVHFCTQVYGGLNPSRVRNTVMFVRNLLPTLERSGVSARRVDVDTLEARLTAEIVSADVVQASASIASACAAKS